MVDKTHESGVHMWKRKKVGSFKNVLAKERVEFPV